MAELILTRAGSALGARLGGRAGAAFGAVLAGAAGRSIDASLFGETRRREGPRTQALHLMGASEGDSVPIVIGRMRVAGELIWAARFTERTETTRMRTGGKGGPRIETTNHRYTASFAVALCEGPVARIERIWANGVEIDPARFAWRLHSGDEDQAPDALIAAIEGQAPAYRGIAYVVFEDLPLAEFGDALPQLSFEVVRGPGVEPEPLERLARGVCLIPGAGEFACATTAVRRAHGPGREAYENVHARSGTADLIVSLEQLERDLPEVRSVMLVVGWFGDDLRCGVCKIRPGVEHADKLSGPLVWRAGGVDRTAARLVSRNGAAPAYGGTPCDQSVIEAIAALKARGYSVGLYPFLFMDVPPGSGLPDPYGGAEQAAYPWRGRITGSDQSAAARAEIAAFFGNAEANHIGFDGGATTWAGPADWGYRRFVLTCARLAQAAGGVDRFVIGSELRGLTTLRDDARAYPAVAELARLAQDVRTMLGAATALTYAADWSEYFGHQPADGSGDVRYHLDPLWAHPAIDAVGVDWYPPLTDWRDGDAHLDRALAESDRDAAYLASRIDAGEGFDWFYASAVDRAAQTRTPITDGAYGEPWIFRPKDLVSWWSNPHVERIGGVKAAQATAWVPRGKPIWLVELGCAAIDKGANAPNLFVDPKSAESAAPPFSSGAPDALIQRRTLEAYLARHAAAGPKNPLSPVYGGPMIASGDIHLWCWDARPYPAFPARPDVWADAGAWRQGHWLNGRAGAQSLAQTVALLCARAGLEADASGLDGVVPGLVVDGALGIRSTLEALMAAYDFGCVEQGGRLVFHHGAAAGTTLDDEVLVAGEDGPVALTREAARFGARVASVRFADPARAYAASMVTALGDPAGRETVALDAGLALDPADADAIVQRLVAIAAARGRTALVAVARGPALALAPGDVVRLGEERWRVERIADDHDRRLTLIPAQAPAKVPKRSPAPSRTPTIAADRVQSVLLDLPTLPGVPEAPLVAIYADPWPGPVEIYAGADAAAALLRARAVAPAAVGELLWTLWPGPAGRWDDAARVRLRLPGATLANVSPREALAGANTLAVLGPAGLEVLQARNATLVGPNTYEIAHLVRGVGGTEHAMAAPAPPGTTVVQLDARLAPAPLEAHEAGENLLWFAGPPREGEGLAFRWEQAARLPLSPVHVRARRDATGDIAVAWVRRTRVDGDSWGPETPLGEAFEAYRVEILKDGAPVRTIETGTPACVYGLLAQQSDFPGGFSALHVRIAQRSDRTGYGRVRESVLWL